MNFQDKINTQISASINTKKRLIESHSEEIENIGKILAGIIMSDGKIMFCGNGGSAADCQHLAAELVVRLRPNINRKAIQAISLTVDTSIITAGGNDYGYENIFSRSVEAYGKKGDALVAISTSGNSENVYRACQEAKKNDVISIGLLGKDGGKIVDVCDYSLIVPSDNTARIQESHIMVGHIWCEIIEEMMFPDMF